MKRIYTFAAALLFLGACTSDGYTIRGNVEGLESPYVYLITFNGTHNVADSAKVEAGAFTFTGKTELPEVAYLSRDKEQPFVRFFLENARISIDGNLYNPNEVYPTGTAANEAMNAFNELTFNTSEAYGVTELEADKKQLVDRYKQQMRETIDRNRDNICGMIILAETGSMFFTPQEVLAEIDRFPAEWQQRTELTDLRKVMEQRLRTTVGQPYVDISAPNADDKAVSLKSVIENPANKYEWSHTVIRNIIANPLYLGHTVMCKTESIFKVGTFKKVPKADQIRVENTHEPLVSQELFDGANAKILSRRRDTTDNFVSPFSGLVKCGTCGKALGLRYWGKDRHHIYVCTTYAHDTKACSDHRIYYEDLYNAVLADIQYHARLAYEDRDKAVALAMKMNAKADGNKGKSNESKLKQAKKRYDEVTRLFDRLYEDSLSGRISNDNFTRLIDKYQTEQEQLLGQIQNLENALQEVKDSQTNAVQWAALMADYVGIRELTAENLNLLVERIEVFDRTETDGEAEQVIRICYRFGGYIGERRFKAKVLRNTGGWERRRRKERKDDGKISFVS